MAKKTQADSQIDMFGGPPKPPEERLQLAEVSEELRGLATRLPPTLRLGTSSWSFPGWQGFVWDRKASTELLAKQGLKTYAQHQLFRTVGIDRTYYAPVPAQVF